MAPKILCLHGAGTSAQIFQIQSRKLATLLAPHFELVYVDGPLECDPGPGVLPIFEDAGPYHKWIHDEFPAPPGEEEQDPPDTLDALLEIYRHRGPFVGLLGFSQGAKIGMLLLRRIAQERIPPPEFMVAVCGTVPFQGIRNGADERSKGFEESVKKGVLKTESVHVIGEDDPWRPQSEELVDFFEAVTRRVIRFKGAHHMPVDDGVNKLLLQWILGVYEGY